MAVADDVCVTDLLASLRSAVDAAPADVTLRVHLGELLLDAGRVEEAVREAAEVLRIAPTSERGQALMQRAMASNGALEVDTPSGAEAASGFDWQAAEEDLGPMAAPMFVERNAEGSVAESRDIERVPIGLADVGGMEDVKDRLEMSFLAPLRNPELRRLYGKSLRGGLLLYGPPGCGKSFLARALAGEMGAGFISISIHDVLDMWVGASERNLHSIFVLARQNAPCVVFIDELDALGRRRSQLGSEAMRATVNQLLSELDGADNNNEGVYVLAATNHPWDIDVALRRPGRFDRIVLVLPPDQAAREAIFRTHLKDRPVAGIDLAALACRSEGFSGADIAHVCESASERALIDAVRTGGARMIEMGDFVACLAEVRPSTTAWFDAARNVVTFANADGMYDDLRKYMKKRGLK